MNELLSPSAPVRRLLGRLEPNDLRWALDLPAAPARPAEWKALLRGPRRVLLQHVLAKTCPNGITHRQLARADIIFRERRDGGGMQQWRALKVLESPISSPSTLSPELVQTRLTDALSPLFRHHTTSLLLEGRIWIRVAIYEGQPLDRPPPSSLLSYILLLPGGQWALASGMSPRTRPALLQALTMALGCSVITPHPLEGRSLKSLQELLLQPMAQGPWGALKPEVALETNPLVHPRIPNSFSSQGCMDNHDEKTLSSKASRDKRRRMLAATRLYGTLPLPTLESLQWHTELPIQPASSNSPESSTVTPDGPIRMSVSLNGPSVLQGLREMVREGVAEPSLPPYLAEIHTLSMNKDWTVRSTGITHSKTQRRISSYDPSVSG
ncbi:centromere protein Chl4/mis15/CENP-N [Piptocephalis cylindrospora]|uniref:Centromere protein Chl4/mis15/CENP-N n=1 Tax=Piptocephalis cylindrospora TaxID=1907219 RepID=A0A4V1IXP2_9FUNG|nr:centromere protein Chl4/mis15/CENP-N [Piptocephalis cylindrospora]|eukprot:RKP11749.1 centromere protein Chl4/mis15/CENP-N [Piptocephalis cylindrospora]